MSRELPSKVFLLLGHLTINCLGDWSGGQLFPFRDHIPNFFHLSLFSSVFYLLRIKTYHNQLTVCKLTQHREMLGDLVESFEICSLGRTQKVRYHQFPVAYSDFYFRQITDCLGLYSYSWRTFIQYCVMLNYTEFQRCEDKYNMALLSRKSWLEEDRHLNKCV